MVCLHMRKSICMVIFKRFPCVQVHLNLVLLFLLDMVKLHVTFLFLEFNFILKLLYLSLSCLSSLLKDSSVCILSLIDLCLKHFDILDDLLADFPLNENFMRWLDRRGRLFAPWVLVWDWHEGDWTIFGTGEEYVVLVVQAHLGYSFSVNLHLVDLFEHVVCIDVDCSWCVLVCNTCYQKLASMSQKNLWVSCICFKYNSIAAFSFFAFADLSDCSIFSRSSKCDNFGRSLLLFLFERLTWREGNQSLCVRPLRIGRVVWSEFQFKVHQGVISSNWNETSIIFEPWDLLDHTLMVADKLVFFWAYPSEEVED